MQAFSKNTSQKFSSLSRYLAEVDENHLNELLARGRRLGASKCLDFDAVASELGVTFSRETRREAAIRLGYVNS